MPPWRITLFASCLASPVRQDHAGTPTRQRPAVPLLRPRNRHWPRSAGVCRVDAGALTGLVVVDEIQRQPELFTLLRPLGDRPRSRARFLILGSASPELVRGASESLAGRVGFVDPGPFDLREVGRTKAQGLWLRGGFPRSFLARTNALSFEWRSDFIRTFLERDIPLASASPPRGFGDSG
jgi:AAA domain